MSPQQHPDGEGPVDPDEARGRVKVWWDKEEHGRKAKGPKGDRDEESRNDDLGDTSKGGKPNWDF